MYFREDPLFAEDYQFLRGRSKTRYPARYPEPRDWVIGKSVETELLKHTSTVMSDLPLVTLHLRAALEALDGDDGQLGQILQTRKVEQDFKVLQRKMRVIGPVATPETVTVETRPDHSANWRQARADKISVLKETDGTFISVASSELLMQPLPSLLDGPEAPLARVIYTAGMAEDVAGLPDDLRLACYTIARRSFDFRDDTVPVVLRGHGASMPTSIAATLSRYTVTSVRDWDNA